MKKNVKRMISALLVLLMVISMLPQLPLPTAKAAETNNTISHTTQNSNTNDGVSLTKTSTYDPVTGEMTISLEAYTTGVVTSTVTIVPTDIVLVLDVSGSMDDDFSDNKTCMEAMEEAVDAFIDATAAQNATVGNVADMHNIAIVKFASASFYNSDNKLAVGNNRQSNGYNYTEVLSNFTPVNTAGAASLKAAVGSLVAGGATAVDYGLELADALLVARSTVDNGAYADRNQVVIVFTDGDPTHGSGYSDQVAYNAVNFGQDLKADGVKIFTVGIFDAADPSNLSGNSNKYMNYLSSNYPKAYGYTETKWLDLGPLGRIEIGTSYVLSAGDGPYGTGHYLAASNSTALTGIFQSISSEVGHPIVSLGSTATLVDVVSDYFTIEMEGENPKITVQTSDYLGNNTWATPVVADGVTATLGGDNDTIYISGFDYDTNYVSQTPRDGFYGRKVIVTITTTPNYTAIDAAGASLSTIPTNDSASLMDSNAVTAAYTTAPNLTPQTITYQVVENGVTRTVATYKRYPGASVTVAAEHTDTAVYDYGDWTTADVSVSGGSFVMPAKSVTFTAQAITKSYTVTYKYLNNVPVGANPATAPSQVTVTVGQPVNLPGVTPPTGYGFSGWEEDNLDIAKGVTSFSMPAQDLVFEGWFTALGNSYTVEHYLMGTDGTYPTSADHSTTYTNVVTDQNVTAAAVAHAGFTYDPVKTDAMKEVGTTMTTINGVSLPTAKVDANGNTTLKLYFARNPHTLKYEYVGTVPTNAPTLPNSINSYYGKEETVAATPTLTGYTFSGWSLRAGEAAITDNTLTMPDQDVTLYGSFTASASTPYTVEHYFKDLGKDTYTKDATKTQHLTGTTDATVTASPLAGLTGFDYDATKSAATLSGAVKGDGSLVLKVYYTRTKNTVTYQYTGTLPTGTAVSQLPTPVTYEYGATVTVAVNATASGYTFSGWHSEQVTASAGETFTMPEIPVVITGGFSPAANQYKIAHYLMNTDGTYPSETEDVIVYTNVKTGDPVSASTDVAHPGFTYHEDAQGEVLSGNVLPNGELTLKVYFKRNQWTVSYQYDGTVPAGASALPTNRNYYYDFDVTLAGNATAPGYTFSGWSIHTGNTAIDENGKMAMPDHNVILHGSFTPNTNTTYTVEHYFENLNDSGYTKDTAKTQELTGTTGTTATATALSGSEILGFTHDPEIDGTVKSAVINGNGNTVLKLYYKRVIHKVTYKYTGTVPSGEGVSVTALPQEVSYKYEQTVTVAPNASAAGYDFSGWSSVQFPGVSAGETFTIGIEDVVFTGHFSPATNKYVVNHYYMDANGNYPSNPDSSNTYTNAKTGEKAVATPVIPTGYEVDSSKSTLEGEIAADGNTVLKVYYARKYYTITYVYEGAVPPGVAPEANSDKVITTLGGSYRHGKAVDVAANASAPGYTFSGWSVKNAEAVIEGGKVTVPTKNIVLHGSFTANSDTGYKVEHYFKDLNANTYTLHKTEEKKGTTGVTVSATPLVGSEAIGFTHDAENINNVKSGPISGDGNLVLKLYYNRTEHNVIYQYTGTIPDGANALLPAGRTNVEYETEVTVEDSPVLTGYTFSGWSSKQVTVSGNDFTMPAGDVVFTGHFTPAANQYTVEHYLMDTNGQYPGAASHSEILENVVTGQSVMAQTNVNHPGFSYDGDAANVLSGTVAADGSTVLKVYFKRNQYTVRYQYDGTIPDGATDLLPLMEGNVYFESLVQVAANASAPGYNFSGWSSKQVTVSGNDFTMPAGDVVFTGYFSAKDDSRYTVEHYFEDLTPGVYTCVSSKELYGTTGVTVEANPLPSPETTGFTYDDSIEGTLKSAAIKGDGSMVLKLYYRRNTYTVTYKYTGTVPSGDGVDVTTLPEEVSYKYGQIVTVAQNATATGYDFSGWASEQVSAVANQNFTMLATNVLFTGGFSAAANKYKVEHYLMDTNGRYPGAASHSEILKNVVTGQAVTAQTNVSHPGFTFDDRSNDSTDATKPNNVLSGTVAADGSTVLKVYFKRNQWTVSYVYDNTVPGASNRPDAEDYFYEENVKIADPATAPGYTFSGWSILTGDTSINQNGKMIMPDHNVILHGSFTAKAGTPYTVEHYFADLEGNYVLNSDKTQTDLTGTTGTSVTAKALSGEGTLGFHLNEDESRESRTGTIKGDGSLVLKLYYDRTKHTVSYQYTGMVPGSASPKVGELSSLGGTYRYGESVQVSTTNVTATGYDFSGWSSVQFPGVSAGKTFTIGIEDVVFTGHFSPATNKYVVNHYYMDANGNYPSNPDSSNTYTNAKTGEKAVATPVIPTGYEVDSSKSTLEGEIAADGNTVLKVYYARKRYAITYEYLDAPAGVTPPGKVDARYGEKKPVATGASPDGYTFDGWSVRTGNAAIVTEDGVRKLIMPAQNVTLYGSFTANPDTAYTVEHYRQELDGSYKLYKTNPHTGTTGTSVTAKALSGYDMVGFTHVSSIEGTISSGIVAGDGSLVLKLYYNRTVHSVSYQYTGTAPAGANKVLPDAIANVKFGSEVTVAGNPELAGYTFSGWYEHSIRPDSEGKFTMPARDVIFSGHFTANPNKYTIEHYLMGLDGKYPETASHGQEYENVVTGQAVTAQTNISHPGFTYDTAAANVTSGTVAADGSTTLKLYFKRNQWTVTYDYTNDVTGAPTLPETKSYYYGESVDVAVDPIVQGYLFSGWTVYSGDTTIENRKLAMPDHNVLIHGTFNPGLDTPYKVEHYLQELDGSYKLYTTTSHSGTTNTKATAMPLSDKGMIGFTYDATETAKHNSNMAGDSVKFPTADIAGNGSTVLKLYYKRTVHTVSYQFTGTKPTGAGNLPEAKEYMFGQTVTVATAPTTPKGYTFHPWTAHSLTPENDQFSMPARDIIFTGYFTANPSHYTVKHYLEDVDGGYTFLAAEEIFSVDVKVNDPVNGVPKTYQTYTYNKEKTRDGNAQHTTIDGQIVPSGTVNFDGTLVLTLYYDRNSYNISYAFEGTVPGEVPVPTGSSHKHGHTVGLADVTPPAGYVFDGWYLDEEKVGTSLVMPRNDVKLIGRFTPATDTKYRVEYYLQNLEDDNYVMTADSFDATGTTGSYVVGPKVIYDGATFNLTKSTWNGHIAADGSTVLKLYYDRDKYNVNYYYYGVVPSDITITHNGTVLPLAGETAKIYTETVKHGATVTLIPELVTDAEGYEFRGWYTYGLTRATQESEHEAGTTFIMPTRDVDFYGAFYTYAVVYDLNGGTLNGSDSLDNRTVTWETAGLLPDGTPEKSGYTFLGWQYNGVDVTIGNTYGDLAGTYTLPVITLTAQWQAKSTPPDPGPIVPIPGTVVLTKVDSVDPSKTLSGVVFDLYKANGTKVDSFITNDNGQITYSTSFSGEYYWLETRPAEGYVMDNTKHYFTIRAGQTHRMTVTNTHAEVPSVFGTEHYAFVIGRDDGLVHPEANITRAEIATIFFRMLNEETRNQYLARTNNFSDVYSTDWYNTAVSTMANMGVIGGYPDGTYRPKENITRAELIALAAHFDPDGDTTPSSFTDIEGHWAEDEINIAANNGWTLGNGTGRFNPDSLITRAEAMALVNRVLQRLPETTDDLLPGMVTWPDNMDTSKWYYLAVQEASNSHNYVRKDNGYEYWTQLTEVPDWKKYE